MKERFEKNTAFNYALIIKTALINIFVTAVFVLLFSVLMYFLQTGYDYATVLATVSLAAGSLVASFYAAKKVAKKGILIGAIVGITTFLIVTIISLFADKGGVTINTLFHFIIIVLSSLIGGIMGVNKAQKRKYI